MSDYKETYDTYDKASEEFWSYALNHFMEISRSPTKEESFACSSALGELFEVEEENVFD